MVEPVHPDLSPRLDTGARILLDLFQDLALLFLLPVNSDASTVTSLISKYVGSSQSLIRGARTGTIG